MTKYLVNDQRVVNLVTEANGLREANIHSSVGIERDGEVLAGIVYCDKTETNVFMHVASRSGVQWVTRPFLKLVFGWPFDGMKVKRVTALVPVSNERAVNFDKKLGFQHEARLSDIFPDGDLLVMKMTREDCRYLS